MPLARFIPACSIVLLVSLPLSSEPESGTLTGIITINGTPQKRTPFDLNSGPDSRRDFRRR
jgi:hypothetical protein